jgi:hypothetical protein
LKFRISCESGAANTAAAIAASVVVHATAAVAVRAMRSLRSVSVSSK